MQRRKQELLFQPTQQAGRATGQIAVEQDGAGVEVFQTQAPTRLDHRLDQNLLAIGRLQSQRLLHGRVERAQADIQTCLREDLHQARDAGQVKRIGRAWTRNEQQVFCFWADLFDGGHGRLHCQGQHLGCQIVEPARKEIGIDRCELEARVTQIHCCVERWRVLHPLQAKPALDDGHRFEDACL